MLDVLLGREAPPIDMGPGTLAEVANAYYARGKEIEMILLRHELNGEISRGSVQAKFRTGELRSFIDIAKAAYELGSRRLTMAMDPDLAGYL